MKMKQYFLLITLLILSAHSTSTSAKINIVPKMYMFGFAASFSDTIVHFTDIQAIDSVCIDSKTRFMSGRENYSYQLRDYLANKMQMPHRTCVVFYNEKREKLEKEYLKMKRIYTTGKKKSKKKDLQSKSHYDIREILSSDFKFQTVDMRGVYNGNE